MDTLVADHAVTLPAGRRKDESRQLWTINFIVS